jgi:hypothetical protein
MKKKARISEREYQRRLEVLLKSTFTQLQPLKSLETATKKRRALKRKAAKNPGFTKSSTMAYLAERTIRSVKSAKDGGFQITESFANRRRLFSKRQGFELKVVDPSTIEITEGKASTRFFKCSSGGSSL